jgi:hypothetical protein
VKESAVCCNIVTGLFRVYISRGHAKETGNYNATVITEKKSPISSRQLVSRVAGAHRGKVGVVAHMVLRGYVLPT